MKISDQVITVSLKKLLFHDAVCSIVSDLENVRLFIVLKFCICIHVKGTRVSKTLQSHYK